MAIGTPLGDSIGSTFHGEEIFGLGGEDTLSSTHNNVRLNGNDGRDRLFHNFVYEHTGTTPANYAFVQSGGDDDDRLEATIDLKSLWVENSVRGGMSGGKGNDFLSADIAVGIPNIIASPSLVALAELHAWGGEGHDFLDLTVRGTASRSEDLRLFADGGSGSDTIVATMAPNHNTISGRQMTDIKGGSGRDDISVTLAATANIIEAASHKIDGGDGDDTIAFDLFLNPNETAVEMPIEILGGSGNDRMTSTINATLQNYLLDLDVTMDGGSGADRMTSNINALATTEIDATNVMNGGNEDDIISGSIFADVYYGDGTYLLHNYLSGGLGHDYIEGTIETGTPGTGKVFNELIGGYGNDVLIGKITDGAGAGVYSFNKLTGGVGQDILVSEGGTARNWLMGGSGNDTMIGGSGRDDMRGGTGRDVLKASGDGSHHEVWDGGSGADIFVFNGIAKQDALTIKNWESDLDILHITALLSDFIPGAASEMDAASMIFDAGFGGDVTLTLNTGTQIIFEGVGTGKISSVADLVDDPSHQLIA